MVVFLNKELTYLRTFPTSGLSANQSDQMIVYSLNYLLLFHKDGQFLPKFIYFIFSAYLIISLRNLQIWMCDIFKSIWLILIFRQLDFFLLFYDS